MIPNVEAIINSHTMAVMRGKLGPDSGRCPNCERQGAVFSLHEKRVRQFLVIVVEVVKKVSSLLMRWKCLGCKQTFTEYPEFALPYKRHVKTTVMALSRKYVGDEGDRPGRVTYEAAVKVDGLRLGYVDHAGAALDNYLAPKTVWRWIGFLGAGKWLEQVLVMIKETAPETDIFRQIKPVSPDKYRREARKLLLSRCLKFLEAGALFQKLFGFSPTSP